MCKKLICLVSVFLILGLADAVSAELIAHWPLDGDYLDATGNGHDGTPLDSILSLSGVEKLDVSSPIKTNPRRISFIDEETFLH